MAKKDHPELLDSVISQITELWENHHKKFFDALDESERKTLMLTFKANMDCSEAAPVVTVELCFRDKTTESGMDVVKSFHSSLKQKLDDPNQPPLPGTEDEKGEKDNGETKSKKRSGRKHKPATEEPAAPASN